MSRQGRVKGVEIVALLVAFTCYICVTSGGDPLVLNFGNSIYTVREDENSVNIPVQLSEPTMLGVTVTYSVSGDSSDYNLAISAVEFPARTTEQNITVSPINDQLEEYNENMTITLGAVTGPAQLGTTITAVLTIIDDDRRAGVLVVDMPTLQFSEASKSITVTVQRVNGSFGTVELPYSVDDGPGNATKAGTDYLWHDYGNPVLKFEHMATSAQFTLVVVDDSEAEADETFTVKFSTPTSQFGAKLDNATGPITITILDNDRQHGALEFVQAVYQVKEKGGQVTLSVQRLNGTTGTVTVSFRTVNGSASSPYHYTQTTATLTFLQGEKMKNLSVPIIDNSVDDQGRYTYFEVQLMTVTGGATLGGRTVARVNILDDEQLNAGHKIIYGFSLRIKGQDFQPLLMDHTSQEYKSLKSKVETSLAMVMENISAVVKITMFGAWPGSVMGGVTADLDKRLDDGTFTRALKDMVKSGQLGSLVLDPSYIPVISNMTGSDLGSCTRGKYLVLSTLTCSLCPVNSYQPATATNVCFKCPDGRTTTSAGTTSIDQCNENITKFVIIGVVAALVVIVDVIIVIICVRRRNRKNQGMDGPRYSNDPFSVGRRPNYEEPIGPGSLPVLAAHPGLKSDSMYDRSISGSYLPRSRHDYTRYNDHVPGSRLSRYDEVTNRVTGTRSPRYNGDVSKNDTGGPRLPRLNDDYNKQNPNFGFKI